MRRREFLGWSVAAGLAIPAGRWLTSVGQAQAPEPPAAASPDWLSHPPIRPLPVPANRPVDESSPAFFLAPGGDDGSDGRSEGRAWRTFARAASAMPAGSTLYLAGGHYWLARTGSWNRSGARGAPLTIRTLPGELAILDYGYREFFEDPDGAWEPVPPSAGGIEGEYRSTRTYALGSERRAVGGNFGDSMVPLFRYLSLYDLRSSNEVWYPGLENNNYADQRGIYCGPGFLWNPATGRIHVRLAHTHNPRLSAPDHLDRGAGFDSNYTGETDPRNLPLVVCTPSDPTFAGSHLRLQDLVVQGQNRLEIGDRGNANTGLEVDGLHLYAGPQPYGMVLGGAEARLTRSRIRGYDAPWSNRFADKNRTDHGLLAHVAASFAEVAHTEFTDHHDGVMLASRNLEADFHHNLVENMNDDGLYLEPRHPTRVVRVYQNLFRGAVSYLPFNGGGEGVRSDAGVGVYVYRNFFDLRRPTLGSPGRADGRGSGFRYGLLTNEHETSFRPDVYFYHNTIALYGRSDHKWYMANLGSDYARAAFRVYNNILVVVTDRPPQDVRREPGDFESRNNLQWSLTRGSGGSRPGDVYADPRLVAFGPDWRDETDVHLRAGSPAIDAGHPIPAEWPDPLRELDGGAPDIGAVPFGVSGTTLGPGADL